MHLIERISKVTSEYNIKNTSLIIEQKKKFLKGFNIFFKK